ncbi:hypothetical protein EV644_13148 [Kribbella orskensis]|uniref:HTH cro/C1-type domain-containing protein n=1 Tax=Kribbella orskensis TaxID=2512216 RepID=A0ABY2B824_9ACTN|nr:hypothetical protein EV642_13348 [Kribbella sp. VKM Ac-2500]TCO11385.1 hypothetical protein EV644_13148 [Kribbella orskensis]
MGERVNGILRRAMFGAGLSEEDLASRMEVDPKTVRRWLEGRMPYPRHRGVLARLLEVDEYQLWPQLEALEASKSRPAEIVAVYPRRSAINREGWTSLFAGAKQEIDVLAFAALFLAENFELVDLIGERANAGVRVRIALGDPNGLHIAQRGREEGIGVALAAKVRNALVLLRPLLGRPGVELRLHDTVLYNSLYRADDQLLVNQHIYGIPAAQAPTYHLRKASGGEMYGFYLDSFGRIWAGATPPDKMP